MENKNTVGASLSNLKKASQEEEASFRSPLRKLEALKISPKSPEEEDQRQSSEQKTERVKKERESTSEARDGRSRSRDKKKRRRLHKKKHFKDQTETKMKQPRREYNPFELKSTEVELPVYPQKEEEFKNLVDELLQDKGLPTNQGQKMIVKEGEELQQQSFSKDSFWINDESVTKTVEKGGPSGQEPKDGGSALSSNDYPISSNFNEVFSHPPETIHSTFNYGSSLQSSHPSQSLPFLPNNPNNYNQNFYPQYQWPQPAPAQYFGYQPPYQTHNDWNAPRKEPGPPQGERAVRSEKERYYKTRICFDFKMGRCNRSKEDCTFAHGQDDLRKPKSNNLCRNFIKGFCKKSQNQCKFVHAKSSEESQGNKCVQEKPKDKTQDQRSQVDKMNNPYLVPTPTYTYFPFLNQFSSSFYSATNQTTSTPQPSNQAYHPSSQASSQPYQYTYPQASYLYQFYPPYCYPGHSGQTQSFSQVPQYPSYSPYQQNSGEVSYSLDQHRNSKSAEPALGLYSQGGLERRFDAKY